MPGTWLRRPLPSVHDQNLDIQGLRAADMPSSTPPTREDIHIFLVSGLEMMRSEETRQRLQDPDLVERPGLELIKLQRQGWDPLGVDQDVGCAALDKVDAVYPGDKEILGLRDAFVVAAQETYLLALEDRRPARLEDNRPMPRKVIVEFFDACNTKMGVTSFQEQLLRHLREVGTMPNQIIVEAQRDLLEVLGFEREHGCRCLSRIMEDFPDDQELHRRCGSWQHHAKSALMNAVSKHQASGGSMPGGAFARGVPPVMKELQQRAMQEVQAMSDQEKQEVAKKMEKKFQVFMNLPEEGRMRHLMNLSEEDRLEFAKAQIVLINIMQQQWAQRNGHRCKAAAEANGAEIMPPMPNMAPPPGPGRKEAPPSQQQMMS